VSEVLLVRHCESTGQAPDAPLSAEGYRQAEALASRLLRSPVDLIVSSPFRRARETIEPFALRGGLQVQVDDRLAERRLASPPVPDWRDYVRRSFDEPDLRAPGGESGAETLARGRAAIDAVLAGGHRLAVVVSHGQLLSLVIDSVSSDFGYAGWASLRNPDVYRLSDGPSGMRVESWQG
jgi:2,3-bisphosphoglycerate-dependent phosphoglycerate mutase